MYLFYNVSQILAQVVGLRAPPAPALQAEQQVEQRRAPGARAAAIAVLLLAVALGAAAGGDGGGALGGAVDAQRRACLLYTSPSPRDS